MNMPEIDNIDELLKEYTQRKKNTMNLFANIQRPLNAPTKNTTKRSAYLLMKKSMHSSSSVSPAQLSLILY